MSDNREALELFNKAKVRDFHQMEGKDRKEYWEIELRFYGDDYNKFCAALLSRCGEAKADTSASVAVEDLEQFKGALQEIERYREKLNVKWGEHFVDVVEKALNIAALTPQTISGDVEDEPFVEAIRLLLPLAKGYAAKHPDVEINKSIIDTAQILVETYDHLASSGAIKGDD